ncbi:MAG TPA: DUF2156 domain-containing protein [Microbacteriaceae bacterium]|nr:DUF2156 domain-containing protein [Microbacteriaceae bacterium]
MTTPPVIRRVLAQARRMPFSSGLAAVVLLAGVISGSIWRSQRTLRHFDLGASVDATLHGQQWWTMWTALIFPHGVIRTAFALAAILMLLGLAERWVGTRNVAVMWALIGPTAIGAGLGLQVLGSRMGEVWAEFSARDLTLNPVVGVTGPLLAASALAPTLWRRRVRLWTFSALIVILLYGGTAATLFATIAATIGAAAGALIRFRNPSERRVRISAREKRTLFGTAFALTAVGPIVGLLRHDSDSPLSPFVYLIERQNVILVLLALILLGAVGLFRGTLWGFALVLVLNLWVIALGLARVDFAVLLSDAQAPSRAIELLVWNATLIVIPAVLVFGLLVFRRELVATPLPRENPGTDRAKARAILERQGGTMSYLTMWAGNRYWFRADGAGYIAYRARGGVALTCGDPVCPSELRESTVREFIAACDRVHLIPALYSASSELREVTERLGWFAMSVGEETVLRTAGLDFVGSDWANIRNALRRGERDGWTVEWTRWADLDVSARREIIAMSEEWVAEKALPEMGFTLGSIRELDDSNVRLLLVRDAKGVLQAATSWLPRYRDGAVVGWTNDFMRRAGNSGARVMEFAIARMAQLCAASGIDELSLSGAPLAGKPDGLPVDGPQSPALQRLGELLAERLEPAYGFRSLFEFKAKFNPDYRTMWLLTPDPLALPAIAAAITRAYLPYLRPSHAVRILRSGSRVDR